MILMCAEYNLEGVPYGAIWALWQQAVMVSSLQWSKTVHRVLQPVLTGLNWRAYQSLQDANGRILERPALPKPLSHIDKTSPLVGHWSHYASSETIPSTLNGPLWPIIPFVLCCMYLVVSAVSRVCAIEASSICCRTPEIHHVKWQLWKIMEPPTPDDPTKMQRWCLSGGRGKTELRTWPGKEARRLAHMLRHILSRVINYFYSFGKQEQLDKALM